MPVAVNWEMQIQDAYSYLQRARETGDKLRIDLAENALNNLLDQAGETLVTRNKGTDE